MVFFIGLKWCFSAVLVVFLMGFSGVFCCFFGFSMV